MNEIKVLITTALGAIGTFIANALGGWGEDMTTLIIFMGIDFLLGVCVAAFFKKSNKSETGALNSNSAFKGLMKKGACLLVVLIANRLDMMLGIDIVRTGVIICFICNEALSIIENLGLMGVPLPSVLIKAIEVLQKKADEEEYETFNDEFIEESEEE